MVVTIYHYYCCRSQFGWVSLARYVLPEKDWHPSVAVVYEPFVVVEVGFATVACYPFEELF